MAPMMGSMTLGQFGGKLPVEGYQADVAVLRPGFVSLFDAGQALATGGIETGPMPRCSPVSLLVNSVDFGRFDYVVRRGNFTLSAVTASEWFSAIQDTRAAFVVIDGSLTLQAGALLSPAVRKLFTVLFVSGNLVIDGTVSMTARGANHSGTGDSEGYVAASDIRVLTGTYATVPTGYGYFSPPSAAYAYYRLIIQSTFSVANAAVSIGQMKLFAPSENGAMTSNSSNGFVASGSTKLGTPYDYWRAFAKDGGNYWVSSGSYTVGTGEYAGSVSTTVSGNSILGEWLQLQYTTAQMLSAYSLAAFVQRRDGMPKSYTLAGSNNGTTWTAIDARTVASSDAWVPFGDTTFYATTYAESTVDPKIPANGGAGCPQHATIAPPPGSNGVSGGTGGGGTGPWDSAHCGTLNGSHGGAGAAGTAFCGGSGAGGGNALDATPNGGAGSAAVGLNAGGGAGNPGGAKSGGGTVIAGATGCGGTLIIIACGTVSGSGSITSAGSKGGDASSSGYNAGGGGSGGGSVTVVYGTDGGGFPIPTAPGGQRGAAKIGAGSVVLNDDRWCGSKGGDGSARRIRMVFFSTLPNQSSVNSCYSTRVLINAYSGPVFRVRRSSDDAQQDFYTDAVQSFVTTGAGGTGAAYRSWIGASTAYVSIWYDQSGNANHATNAVNDATQPNIAMQSGKYVVQWKKANATVLTMGTAVSPKGMYCTFYNTNPSYGSIISRGDGTDYGMRFGVSGISVNGASNSRDWFYSSSGTKVSYVNGISSTTVALNTWNIMSLSVQTPTAFSLKNIGMDGYSASRSINGYMSEMVMYNTEQIAGDMTMYSTASTPPPFSSQ